MKMIWRWLLVLGGVELGMGLMYAHMLLPGDGGGLHSAPAAGIPSGYPSPAIRGDGQPDAGVTTGNTMTFDLLPLEAGREWVYEYYWKHKTGSAGMWDYSIDSGRVSYVVIDSVRTTDTTITWSIQETAHLLHRQWRESSSRSRDTAYRIDTVVNLSLVEHVPGLHMIECAGRVWSFRVWKYGEGDAGPYPNAAVYRFWTDSLLVLRQTDHNAESQYLHFSASLGLFKREFHFQSGVYYSDDILATLAEPTDPTSAPDLEAQPVAYALAQNYPNPFNPSTTIEYELPKSSVVRLSVYDMLGREVSVLVNERMDAGVHEAKFDASGLSSGMYFYRLQAGDFVQARKLLLLR